MVKGSSHTEESKRKIGMTNKGRMHSDETRRKMSEASKGRKHSPEHVYNQSITVMKPVLCVDTGKIYASVTEAAQAAGVKVSALSWHMRHGCIGSKCGKPIKYRWRYL